MRNAFIGITGEAAPAMLESLRESSAFMASEKVLLREYNMAYMLVGKTLADRLPEAFQYLSKVAVATGDDVAYLMERLTRSVGRLSTRWMAYIGTVVPLEEATKRATVMFGKEADALSRAEIQAAMLDGVLEKLKARTSVMPEVLGTTTQMLKALKAGSQDLMAEWTTHFLPVARSLFKVINTLITAFRKLIGEGGALYRPIRKLAAAFSVLFDILGEVAEKVIDLVDTSSDKLEGFADRILSIAWNAIAWGATIVTNLASGIIRGASQALTAAMNFVARLLEYWLAPGSAPLIVSNILNWGASAFTEFLRGFSMAQFDVLEGVQAPLKRALDVLADLELITPLEAGEQFISLSEGLAEAVAEFGRTGQVTGDIFTRLVEVGGGYGESIAELLRRQLGLATAVEYLAAAEERLKRARKDEEKANTRLSASARAYNKLVRQGADPAVLKAKLAEVKASYASLVAAREETIAAEEAQEAAADQVKAQKEQVKLQERLLNQLIIMGQAMIDIQKAKEKGAEEAEGYEIPPIEWPEIHVVPIDQAFEDLKESIRKKFEELWATLGAIWEESGAYEAIMRLGEAWERLKTAMAPVITWIGEKWEGLKEWWKVNGPLIAAWINEHLIQPFTAWVSDTAWPWVVEQWESWSAWWDENGPIIKAKLSEIGQTVAAWVTDDAWPWVVEQWESWKKWWEVEGPGIKEKIGEIYEKVEDWIVNDAWAWATKEWDKWKIWWEEDGPVVKEAIKVVVDFVIEKLHQLQGELGLFWNWITGGEGWTAIWETAGSIITEFWREAKILTSGAMESIRTTITLISQLITGDWAGAWESLIDLAEVNWQVLIDLTGPRLRAIWQTITSWDEAMRIAGGNLILKLREGFDQKISDITGFFSGLFLIIHGILTGGELWRIRNAAHVIMDSFRAAMYQKMQDIADAFSNIIRWAIQAAKDALSIRSPSKEFLKIGEGLMQGFVKGIENMADEPAALIKSIAKQAAEAAGAPGGGFRRPVFKGPELGLAGAGVSAAGAAGAGPTFVIYNNFGADSVRSDRDIQAIADAQQRMLELQGVRGRIR